MLLSNGYNFSRDAFHVDGQVYQCQCKRKFCFFWSTRSGQKAKNVFLNTTAGNEQSVNMFEFQRNLTIRNPMTARFPTKAMPMTADEVKLYVGNRASPISTTLVTFSDVTSLVDSHVKQTPQLAQTSSINGNVL